MKAYQYLAAFKTLLIALILSSIYSCNSNSANNKVTENSTLGGTASKESIHDSIVKFLINSASGDFSRHQPPTIIDFRHVNVGYVKTSTNVTTYVLCGEFLSREKKDKEEWEKFATVKTSGYEQYMGNQALSFCEKATMVSTDEANLSTELKNKLGQISK